jgi:hypothetical protein
MGKDDPVFKSRGFSHKELLCGIKLGDLNQSRARVYGMS